MKVADQPFVLFSIQTFKLLPRKRRLAVIQNIIFSIILAFLEVVSLTVILPLLHMLINGSKIDSLKVTGALTLSPLSIHWDIILVTVVGLYLLKNTFAIWHTHKQSRFLDELYVLFSKQIYQQFYRQSWTCYTRENSSESFRKIKNTPYEFTHNVLHNYLALVPEALICLLTIIVVLWFDYRILFVLLLLLLPLIVFYYFFKKKVILPLDGSFRELTPKVSITLSQGIDSFAEAKMYKAENYFIQHFITLSKITTHQLSRLKTFINLPARLAETIGILCFAGIILYGKLYPGSKENLLLFLAMLSLIIYRVLPSLNKIFINLSQIQAYAYVVAELQEVLETPDYNVHLKARDIKFNQAISLKSVSFEYDYKSHSTLLKNLTTTIHKGDFIVVGGASGTGKTTFIHLIGGLILDYEGTISIDDAVLTKETLQSWQAKLGFVSQSPVVLQDTILQNIAFGTDSDKISMKKIQEVLELAGILELVNSFPLNLNTPVGENGLTLSGGQRQRLILARALYRDPDVLLLDEVTNQLDIESKSIVLKNLQRLTKRGKTVVLVSHDPVAKNFASRNFHLENGYFIETTIDQTAII